MSNPLSRFVPVEERDDGVYISVARELSAKLDIRDMIQALEQAGVVNYDAERIRAVVHNARGGYERVGDPFEYYDTAMDKFVEIKVTPLRATIQLSSASITERVRFTEHVLRHFLAMKGVCCGIKEDVLKKLADEPTYDTEITIAEGIPPKNGRDSEIQYEVNVTPDSKPTVGKGGKVDYREIRTFTSVKQGQVIARRIPPTEGEPGKTVTGELIAPQPGKDNPLPRGQNTTVSQDGQFLIAEKTGIVYEEGHLIHVDELLQVRGDVDFSVGNVKYSGNVEIRGNVKPGFVVEAEGDIEISGEVESANIISRNGSVVIHHGVIGKGGTSIFAKNGITIEFAQNADLRTDGKLSVGKFCLHCTIYCNVLEAVDRQSSIVGGGVQAYEYIEAQNIGNENNVPTRIILVNKEKAMAEDKLKELEALKEKIAKQLAPVMRELKSKSAILKKSDASIIGDMQREQMKKVVDAFNNLNAKLKYIEKKIGEATAAIEKPVQCDGYIKVRDTIYPGVELSLYGAARKVIQVKMTAKLFRIEKGELAIEG